MIDYEALEDTYQPTSYRKGKRTAPVSARHADQYRAECGKNRAQKKLTQTLKVIRAVKYGEMR